MFFINSIIFYFINNPGSSIVIVDFINLFFPDCRRYWNTFCISVCKECSYGNPLPALGNSKRRLELLIMGLIGNSQRLADALPAFLAYPRRPALYAPWPTRPPVKSSPCRRYCGHSATLPGSREDYFALSTGASARG